MLLDTSFDIKNIICSYFNDLRDAINLYNINKDHQENIMIKNLYDIPIKYLNRFNQQIIEQNKYRYVEKFGVIYNEKISNVNHMKKTLKILDCSKFIFSDKKNGIDQNGILELNLIELYAGSNEKIKNVNHMKKTLKVLDCSWNCGIDQNGIFELNLIELYANSNEKIKNVNHMKDTLKILHCASYCGIDQYGISELNLIKLYAIYNDKIRNVNQVKKTGFDETVYKVLL